MIPLIVDLHQKWSLDFKHIWSLAVVGVSSGFSADMTPSVASVVLHNFYQNWGFFYFQNSSSKICEWVYLCSHLYLYYWILMKFGIYVDYTLDIIYFYPVTTRVEPWAAASLTIKSYSSN